MRSPWQRRTQGKGAKESEREKDRNSYREQASDGEEW